MMVTIAFAHDPELVIPVPADDFGLDALREWANSESTRLSRLHRLDEGASVRLVRALESEHAAIRGDAAGFVAVDPITRSFTGVRVGFFTGAMPASDRTGFLQPVEGAARLRIAPSGSFGIGCSASYVVPAYGGTAVIRWLYIAEDATLIAEAAPIPLAATLSVGAIGDAVLRSIVVDGVLERAQASDFDPEAVIENWQGAQAAWAL